MCIQLSCLCFGNPLYIVLSDDFHPASLGDNKTSFILCNYPVQYYYLYYYYFYIFIFLHWVCLFQTLYLNTVFIYASSLQQSNTLTLYLNVYNAHFCLLYIMHINAQCTYSAFYIVSFLSYLNLFFFFRNFFFFSSLALIMYVCMSVYLLLSQVNFSDVGWIQV